MKSGRTTVKKLLFLLIPFILITLIMLPRLLSPQFGFFDDARMLSQSEKFLQGDFSMSHDKQAGRFRPVYWLYYAIIYALAGYHPFWFFLGNLLIFYVLLYEIRLILKKMGLADWQIFFTSLIFILTMPIIENFYTLSKGEPLQLAFMLASILLIHQTKPDKPALNRWIRGILSSLCLLTAIMIKETAIVMLAVTFLWAAVFFFSKDEAARQNRKTHLALFVSTGAAVVVYFLLRKLWGATSLMGGTYTDRYLVDLSDLTQKVLRWATQFAFYFHYLLPLILAVLLLFIFKKQFTRQERSNLLLWGIWWAFWFAILIPWEYAELYYLLPFGFGSAMLIGLVIPPICRSIKANRRFKRCSILALSIMAAILFILTLPNYLTDAKTQLTFDQVNYEMLTAIVEYASKDSTIYTNIQTSNEYSEKLEVSLREHYQLDDITYSNVDGELLETLNEETDAFVLMPFIDNQPALTVRAGVEEDYQKNWNETMLSETEGNRVLLESFSGSFQLSNVNLPILICPILGEAGFCEDPDPLIDTRIFTYGWDIYQIE